METLNGSEIQREILLNPNESCWGGYLFDLCAYSKTLFKVAIERSFPQLQGLPVSVQPCSQNFKADYQCQSALSIFPLVKSQPGAPKSPQEVAELLIEHFPSVSAVSDIGLTGPGFINITFSPDFLCKLMDNIYRNGAVFPKPSHKKRIVIDFSSPNIAKQMHVGHLRSTIIGDTLSRVFEYLGHEVFRLNHVGDWGTQFGMLICHLEDKFPDFATESPAIGDLQVFYQESKKRFDEDEGFRKRAYKGVVTLQNGDPTVTRAWKLICDVSRAEFQRIYDKLDINIEEKGESFYQQFMPSMVQYLESKGLLTIENGRKLMYCMEGKPPLTVQKSDGGFTYDTSDLAALRYRLIDMKADWVLYVVDAGQSLHFELIFEAAKLAGILDPTKHRVEHVAFGVVHDASGKKFKTRSGETVKLQDLLDKAVQHAATIAEEKRAESHEPGSSDVSGKHEVIAYSAIKYADLKNRRTADYSFSFERMMSLKGDTAARLLYSYARIVSISKKAGEFLSGRPPLEKLYHPSEIKLIKQTLRFPEVVRAIEKDLMPHGLCSFLYNLSDTFNIFYRDCKCVEVQEGTVIKVNINRLTLCDAVAIIFRQCFYLLGLKTVDSM
ncbi:probable arginine--tRNA ligase, cytoplasmic [Zophobas morio]|uniref:probable arginine--tRNA ligase, cytoplasmic n=1 Tax=Zophobas morio TaxID=2755281 RepID=UPI0030832F53